MTTERGRVEGCEIRMIPTISTRMETTPGSAPTLTRGLTHHLLSQEGGLAVKATRICTVEGCERGGKLRRGMCVMHYRRAQRAAAAADKPRPVGKADRFWMKVDKSGACWVWAASCTPDGYGKFWIDRRLALAHRLAFEMLVGPIPDGLELDHLCRVRHCVNPDHLEPVTHAENVRRSRLAAHQTGATR